MKSAVWFFIGFIFGAAGAAYVTKSICEKKAEDKIEKATVEARDYYKEKYDATAKKEQEAQEKYKEATRIYGKAFDIFKERNIEPFVEEPEVEEKSEAYRIDADEFGEDHEYSTYSLDYYSDGNLVDETGNIVDDPIHLVGGDVLDNLCLENPVVYVRNDVTKTDYEICFVNDVYDQPGGEDD